MGRFPYVHVASMINYYGYSDVKNMLHSLKYHGRKDIAIMLGLMIGKKAVKSSFFKNIDIIVPIPLHNIKFSVRGYNQASQIAIGVSEAMHIPVRENIVIKHIHTTSQTKKGRVERVKNVYNSFSLKNKASAEGRHILIIDDVLTTGATIEACANRLLEARGTKISVMTVCLARS